MKILPGISPDVIPDRQPSPVEKKAVIAPVENTAGDLKIVLEEFVQHAMGEIHLLRDRFEKAHAEETGTLHESNQAISKLAEDMEGLRNAVSEIKSSVPLMPPPGVVPPAQDNALVMETLAAVTKQMERLNAELAAIRQVIEAAQNVKEKEKEKQKEKPADPPPPSMTAQKRDAFLERIGGSSPSEPVERKVAFLTKLWDYLNEVAIEIPLRKQN